IKRMASVNRDIMLRTLCLIFAFAWFTNQGASTGDVTLAANAILMQFVTFAAFFLDGFALAAESLIGMATGSFNTGRLRRAMRYSFELAFATAAGLALCFFYAGNHVITWLTTAQSVITAAETYLVWVIAAPLLSVACYLLDGIFIGATRTLEMRNAMMVSLTGYLLAWYLLTPVWQNHGLWASLMIFFVLRALTLWYYYPRLFSRQ
ncbi:MAG: MATE family efflux transporter, partial [Gammaproteobacteria bacterium]|nr:MATE family efflux transporter [Gammaproteobacteria bacterium]